MIATKRYEYLPTDRIKIHPTVGNHREVNPAKVAHYERDILKNGLLEPLVVWEKAPGELFLIGGFHRLAAITAIRGKNPGYFDYVDVRVVAGNPDEMRALNLKLNADRLNARITDYFDTVIYLNNVNWTKERIAEFLDKSSAWIEDIIRLVPLMDTRVRTLLEQEKLSWTKAKAICRAVQQAEPGKERVVVDQALAALNDPQRKAGQNKTVRPLNFRTAKSRLSRLAERNGHHRYTLGVDDLMALVKVLEGKQYEPGDVERVRERVPDLFSEN